MPGRPHLVGFKLRIRVATLGPDNFLEARCMACQHRVRIAPWQLHARFHAEAKMYEVARFWRCQGCGKSGDFEWNVWQAHPPAELMRVETPMERIRRERREEEFQERCRRARGDGGDAA